tara:strand:- start:518 stop:637 length:120 start_codon:yes stop_codon:yes gene_type:complete
MKTYLCKEGTEVFTIEAINLEQAEGYAEVYNAVVIKEVQ